MVTTKMKNEITLLDTNLLEKKELFKEVMYWKNLLGLKIGWGYMLDFIWQLDRFDSLKLPKGSLILDAGAGYGLLQYILAARGYNIVSVDYRPRKLPIPMRWIFPMSIGGKYDKTEEYVKYMDKHKLPWWIKIPYEIKRWLFTWNIRFVPHLFKKYGSIEFVEGNFSKLNYEDNYFDCVISTSAIEHNKDLMDVEDTIIEMERVLKPNKPMLVTSAASPENSFFLKDVYCWCFSKEMLSSMFEIFNNDNYDQFDRIYNNNINDPYIGKIVRKRFKGRLPEYISVGIEKWK